MSKLPEKEIQKLPEDSHIIHSLLPETHSGQPRLQYHSLPLLITSAPHSHHFFPFITTTTTTPRFFRRGGWRVKETPKMGQGLSCGVYEENELFNAVQNGELDAVEAMADKDPNLLALKTVHGRLSPLHVAAVNGRIEVPFTVIFLIGFVGFSFSIVVLMFFLKSRLIDGDCFGDGFLHFVGSFNDFGSVSKPRYLESTQTGLYLILNFLNFFFVFHS